MGTEQAALDAAIACGIEYSGWCPPATKAEIAGSRKHYQLTPVSVPDSPNGMDEAIRECIRQNLILSDGIIIFVCSHGDHDLTWLSNQLMRTDHVTPKPGQTPPRGRSRAESTLLVDLTDLTNEQAVADILAFLTKQLVTPAPWGSHPAEETCSLYVTGSNFDHPAEAYARVLPIMLETIRRTQSAGK